MVMQIHQQHHKSGLFQYIVVCSLRNRVVEKMFDNFTHSLKVRTIQVKINQFVHIFVDLHWKPFVFILHTTLFSYHWLKGIFIDRVSILHVAVSCLWNNQLWNGYLLTLTEEINKQKLCIWTNNHTEVFLCRFSMCFKKSKISNTGHSMS